MNVLLWVIFGGIAGWVASIVVGREEQMGFIANIAVGIVGALLGGWIADRMGFGGKPGTERPTSLAAFGTAVMGAVLLLIILNALR